MPLSVPKFLVVGLTVYLDTVNTFCFVLQLTVTDTQSHQAQHCEIPGCGDEVFAACNVGTCLDLLCFEHFDGTLTDVHKGCCRGRTKPDTAAATSFISTVTGRLNLCLSVSSKLHLSMQIDRIPLKYFRKGDRGVVPPAGACPQHFV